MPDPDWDVDHELMLAKSIVELEVNFHDLFSNEGANEDIQDSDIALTPSLIVRDSLSHLSAYFNKLYGWGWKEFVQDWLSENSYDVNSKMLRAMDEIEQLIDWVLSELSEDSIDSEESANHSISALENSKESTIKLGQVGSILASNIPGFLGPNITTDTPLLRCAEAVDDLVEIAQNLVQEAFDEDNEYKLVQSIKSGTFTTELTMEILGVIITGHSGKDSYEIELDEAPYLIDDLKSSVDENNSLITDMTRRDRNTGKREVVRRFDFERSVVEQAFKNDFDELRKELF